MHHQYENYKVAIPTQQCISIVLEAYWTIHKPINFSFHLLIMFQNVIILIDFLHAPQAKALYD